MSVLVHKFQRKLTIATKEGCPILSERGVETNGQGKPVVVLVAPPLGGSPPAAARPTSSVQGTRL